MSQEKIEDPVLKRDLAVAYERVGELQGSTSRPSLGDRDGALASYQKALAIRRSLPIDSPQARRELILLYSSIGTLESATSRPTWIQTYATGEMLASGKWKTHKPVADALAGLLYQRGQHRQVTADAIRDFRAAEAIFSDLLTDKGYEQSANARTALAMTRMHLGQQLIRTGDFVNGIPALHRSVEAMKELSQQDPINTRLKRNLGICLNHLGAAYLDRTAGPHRNFDQALRYMQESRELLENMSAADPANRTVQRDVIRAISYVGRAHAGFDKWEQTIRYYGEALAKLEALEKVAPNERNTQEEASVYLAELATATYHVGKLDDAEAHCRRAIAIWDRLIATGSGNRFHRFNSALVVRRLGDIARDRGNGVQARELYQQSLATFEDLANADKSFAAFQLQIKMSREALSKLDAIAEKR
jgi:non-specific serine/threonine protein kinase/serine/threonine-protein kinase